MFFNDWLNILLFKKKPAEIAGVGIGAGLKNLVIASVIVGILNGILQWLALPQMLGASGAAAVSPLLAMLGPVFVVVSAIATPIVLVIVTLIMGAILHLFCLIVGGKGSISNYIGALAMLSAAISGTATVLLTIIGIIGAAAGAYLTVMMVIGLIGLLAGLWQLVLTVLVTQTVQQISLGRAIIAVIVIPVAIAIVLALALGALIFAMIMGSLGGGLGGATAAMGLPFA